MKINRKASLAAGISILVMAIVAGFSLGYAHNSLVLPGEIANTVNNLKNESALFNAEILGWMVILICDLIASIALFKYFKEVNRKQARLMAAFRIVYSGILAFAIANLIKVSRLINSTNSATPETLQIKVMNFITTFEKSWSLGLIVFGIHLLVLGYLVFKSVNIHKIWGILLLIAGISYCLIHTATNFIPGSENIVKIAEKILMAPMTIAEVGFAIWLIVRGKNPNTIYHNNSKTEKLGSTFQIF